jgi:hypothetical protein
MISFRSYVLDFWDGMLLLCSCVASAVYAVVGVELLLHDQPGCEITLRLSDIINAFPRGLTVAVGDLIRAVAVGGFELTSKPWFAQSDTVHCFLQASMVHSAVWCYERPACILGPVHDLGLAALASCAVLPKDPDSGMQGMKIHVVKPKLVCTMQ